MVRSIRWRLQAWYAVVLIAVVVGFGAFVYFQARASRLREVDDRLEAATLYLAAALRGIPPWEFDGGGRPGGPGGPGGGPGGPGGPGRDRPVDERPGGPGPGPPRQPGMGPPRLSEVNLPNELDPPQGNEADQLYFAIWHESRLVKASRSPRDSDVTLPLRATPRPEITSKGDYREAAMLGPTNTRIVVGRSVRRELDELRALALQLVGAGAVVLVVGLAGGWLISSRVVRPIKAMSVTASSISAANLSDRIDARNVDAELAQLAGVLNAMFDRLESAFQRQAQFTADASHELRTPLAIIRTHAELALTRSRSPEEYRHTLEKCLKAAGRMNQLVDGLLTLARADAGDQGLKSEPVELSEVVAESVSLVRPLALERGLKMTAELADAEVVGDATALAQVVTNLVHNAIQYNRPDGTVHVALTAENGEAELKVIDTGSGIPDEDRPHIFERFYRVDKSRSRAVGGNGLGLAICKSIVEAHGGRIGFDSKVTEGTTFWVRLPRRAVKPRRAAERSG